MLFPNPPACASRTRIQVLSTGLLLMSGILNASEPVAPATSAMATDSPARLSGSQEVPPVKTAASATSMIVIGADFSVTGTVVTAVSTKQSLWNSMVQAWLPEGAESSKVVLLKVMVEHAEYWDSSSNKLVRLIGIVKALTTGTPPRDIGDHQTVAM